MQTEQGESWQKQPSLLQAPTSVKHRLVCSVKVMHRFILADKHLHIHPAVELPKRRTKTKLFDDKETSVRKAPVRLSKNILCWFKTVSPLFLFSLPLLLFLSIWCSFLQKCSWQTSTAQQAATLKFSVPLNCNKAVSTHPTFFRYHQTYSFCAYQLLFSCCCYLLSIFCTCQTKEELLEKQKLLFFLFCFLQISLVPGEEVKLKWQGPIKQQVDWQACWEGEGVKGFFSTQSYHSVPLKAKQRSTRQTSSWHGF